MFVPQGDRGPGSVTSPDELLGTLDTLQKSLMRDFDQEASSLPPHVAGSFRRKLRSRIEVFAHLMNWQENSKHAPVSESDPVTLHIF